MRRFRGEVRSHRISSAAWLKRRLLRQGITPLDTRNLDAWVETLERGHSRFHAWAQHDSRPFLIRAPGGPIDLETIWAQHRAIEFDRAEQLAALCREAGGRPVRTPFLDRLYRGIFRDLRAWLAFGVLQLGRGKGSNRDRSLSGVKCVVRGIATAECAEKDGELDFAWWVRLGFLRAEEALFILPAAPSLKAQERLRQLGLRWITDRQVARLVPAGHALGITIRSLRWILSDRYSIILRALIWEAFLRESGIRILVTSLSECWPEQAEVATARGLGIRTIEWAYAGSSFYFSRQPGFRDISNARCAPAASELWNWSELVNELYLQRAVVTPRSRPARMEAIGPMMAGDSRLLGQHSEALLRGLGISEPRLGRFFLAVFDIPVIDRAKRFYQDGSGTFPMLSAEAQEGLFSLAVAALRKFPEIIILRKTKRDLHQGFVIPPSYRALVDPEAEWNRASRVIDVGYRTDPYLAVAACDGAVGTAFTSPPMACQELGKPAFYFDPAGAARHSFHDYFADKMAFSIDEGLERISRMLEVHQTLRKSLRDAYAAKGQAAVMKMHDKIRQRLSSQNAIDST